MGIISKCYKRMQTSKKKWLDNKMKKIFTFLHIYIFILFLVGSLWAANEIQFSYPSTDDPNIYCIIGRATDANVWDVVNITWATWADANEPNYALDLSFSYKDFYKASFPAGITGAGIYPLTVYKWEGAEPNVTDDLLVGADEFNWDGSAEITNYTAYTDRVAITTDTNELQDGWAGLVEDINEVPTAAENRDAVFNKTGLTEGGTWPFGKIVKLMITWMAGNWQESGDPNVYDILDAEDCSTPVMDVNIADLKKVTVP